MVSQFSTAGQWLNTELKETRSALIIGRGSFLEIFTVTSSKRIEVLANCHVTSYAEDMAGHLNSPEPFTKICGSQLSSNFKIHRLSYPSQEAFRIVLSPSEPPVALWILRHYVPWNMHMVLLQFGLLYFYHAKCWNTYMAHCNGHRHGLVMVPL